MAFTTTAVQRITVLALALIAHSTNAWLPASPTLSKLAPRSMRTISLKGGGESELPAELVEKYESIKRAQPQQQAKYAEWLKSGAVDTEALTKACNKLGLNLDVAGGQISYKDGPASARFGGGKGGGKLCYDLMYVRHGKTTGNTEPRVFQGYVDEETNALNEIGLGQAEEAADKLDPMNLSPDLVVLSPLSRASETGKAYLKRHPELADVTETWDSSHEMAFGDWDNKMVKDFPDDDIAHLFYLSQNAVVKASGPYPGKPDAPIENFVDTLVRLKQVLLDCESRVAAVALSRKANGLPPPLVLMYGHSMAGAAIGVLTGNGKVVDGQNYLGFDGKYILPNATPVLLHEAERSTP